MEKRTPKGWTEYLAQEENPVTLSEYMAACLSRMLGATIETAQASGHTEGMLTRLDAYLARRDALYGMSGGEAAAMLAREDTDRRCATQSCNGRHDERAAIQRAGELGSGEHAV